MAARLTPGRYDLHLTGMQKFALVMPLIVLVTQAQQLEFKSLIAVRSVPVADVLKQANPALEIRGC
jgi:hypothetical protein